MKKSYLKIRGFQKTFSFFLKSTENIYCHIRIIELSFKYCDSLKVYLSKDVFPWCIFANSYIVIIYMYPKVGGILTTNILNDYYISMMFYTHAEEGTRKEREKESERKSVYVCMRVYVCVTQRVVANN